MGLALDADSTAFAATIRQAIDRERARAVRASIEAVDHWSTLTELDVTGVGIPAGLGGTGVEQEVVVAVMEALGSASVAGPLICSTVWGAQTLLALPGNDVVERLVPSIADGSTVVAVALLEDNYRWAPCPRPALRAVQRGDDWVLWGGKRMILDADRADRLLVSATTQDGPALLLVDLPGSDLVRSRHRLIDRVTQVEHIRFEGAPAIPVSRPGDYLAAVEAGLRAGALAVAAYELGGAQACLDMALNHSRTRKQFDTPIGSFQSIKHLLVDLAIDVECARSAVYLACAHEHSPALFARYVAAAKAWCSRVYLRAAGANIQIHGGIGFSAEHLASRHFTRATVTRTMFGDPDHHLDLLADLLGL